MDGLINNEATLPPSPFPEVPSAPPPPPEVKVRTMRSDLESMAKSGGGLPRFQNVKVAGLAMAGKNPAEAVARQKREKALIIALAAVAAVAIIALIGYFVYKMFFAGSVASPQQSAQSNAGTASAPSVQSSTATSTSAAQSVSSPVSPSASSFIHTSLFKKPADQVLNLTLSTGGTVTSATDLQTFNQKLSTLLATANKSANLIEIDAKGTGGQDMSIEDIFSQANAQILDPSLLAANFNPDATFFVYRDKNGFWPGYVLSLQTGKNWLFLESDVAKLETSPNISNLFLQNVGAPSASGFTDGTASGTAVRALPFSSANPPASFVYGWYQSRLIISTSPDGFKEAMVRL